ncbi:MAG: DNA primase [Clostridia bacterium]|nr:DNA primase [Clostridia bacterium]
MAEKNDIYELVSQYVSLKRAGSSYVGLCPFHNEKTPSFSVSPHKGIFHCFGCGEGGNSIGFLMKIENISFYEAVTRLAERANIELPKPDTTDFDRGNEKKKERELVYAINKDAATKFYENLKTSKIAIEYFKNREIDGAWAKKFWLGFAKDSWDDMFVYLKDKGYTESDILKAGLITGNDNGKFYDRFRNRVIFPIFDERDNIIGFGGRVLNDDKPKYLNSSEGLVFSKGKNLFSLNNAKRTRADFVILVEGYMDVIALAMNGYTNTVATLGTALTPDQAKILKKYFKEVVLCYDSDSAGRTATNRAITIMRQTDLKASVMYLSGGKDPDEFIKKMGKDAFNSALEARKTDITYLIEYYREKYEINIDGQKVAYIDELIPYLLLITNPVELDVYVNKLANLTEISTQSLYSQLGIKKVNSPQKITQAKTIDKNKIQGGRSKVDITRESLLALLLSNRQLYEHYGKYLSDDLFGGGVLLDIFLYIKSVYEEGKNIDINLMMVSLKEDNTKQLARILSIDTHITDEIKAFKDYLKTLKEQVRREKIYETLSAGNVEQLNDMIKKNN